MWKMTLLCSVAGSALALTPVSFAATVANPICPDNTALYDPGHGQDIVVSPGFTVSVFKAGLNFPTGIAFRRIAADDDGRSKGGEGFDRRNKDDDDFDKRGKNFEVYVLESGHGLPSRCNEQDNVGTGQFDPTNPFTPDIRCSTSTAS